MNKFKDLIIKSLILLLFILPTTHILAESAQQQNSSQERSTHEKQKVEKSEMGRYYQQKSDADLSGRTSENKANFDPNVPRGEGVESPPANK